MAEPLSLLASEPQYLSHLAAIWFALDPSERGDVYLTGKLADQPAPAIMEGLTYRVGVPPADRLTLVASHTDLRHLRGPAVFVEHGAGQRYLGDGKEPHPSYAGSPDHDRVALFVCPRQEVCDWWAELYPSTPSVAAGCPKLDVLHRTPPAAPEQPTVAVSFHSDVRLCQETASSWAEYDPHLPAFVTTMRSAGWEVLGHGHPRLWSRLRPRWEQLGVEPVESFDEVLRRATVYACDNSSTLYEFASTDRPVVAINGRHYRRNIEHGLRFWSHIPGICCDNASALASSVIRALADEPAVRDHRRWVISQVYAHTDGFAAQRAVLAIRACAGSLTGAVSGEDPSP